MYFLYDFVVWRKKILKKGQFVINCAPLQFKICAYLKAYLGVLRNKFTSSLR